MGDKIKIEKMTLEEAIQYVEKKKGGIWEEDYPEYVRYCNHCRMWVHVDEYSGDIDKCDAC